jgi:hypothetical protein
MLEDVSDALFRWKRSRLGDLAYSPELGRSPKPVIKTLRDKSDAAKKVESRF